MNRIAPNNQLPATHFIEVYSDGCTTNMQDRISLSYHKPYSPFDMEYLDRNLRKTKQVNLYTVCLFRIRENKLPTKHNFNK